MEVVEHAEAWFDKHRSGPHFVWVHMYDPHDPYEPPPPFSEKYKDHLYDGEIAYADSALAHWIAFLKKAGVYDNAHYYCHWRSRRRPRRARRRNSRPVSL